ncbi:MAG TPA: DUF599 family protein [Methylomirabilota bacterium]|nr:DUF599 family protein [Methylomirabilota bacterium]
MRHRRGQVTVGVTTGKESRTVMGLGQTDFFAVGWFVFLWVLQSYLTEASPWRRRTLTHAMNREREAWIRRMSERDLRMIDTAIMAGLQNGTAFFASTSLLAIGGGFALLNATDRVVEVFSDLPLLEPTSRAIYELKVMGLIVIYAYAFFKFGWAYRLFNYGSILIGSVPHRQDHGTPEMETAVRRAAAMTVIAGRHFNRGLRAFFMSVGYLGWFLGAWPLVAAASVGVVVLVRRQFHSDSRSVLLDGEAR